MDEQEMKSMSTYQDLPEDHKKAIAEIGRLQERNAEFGAALESYGARRYDETAEAHVKNLLQDYSWCQDELGKLAKQQYDYMSEITPIEMLETHKEAQSNLDKIETELLEFEEKAISKYSDQRKPLLERAAAAEEKIKDMVLLLDHSVKGELFDGESRHHAVLTPETESLDGKKTYGYIQDGIIEVPENLKDKIIKTKAASVSIRAVK